jgi:Na+-transporting methylmalonyl-CoA/oxaloacetate decarboxylase gamma subunit
MMKPALKLLGWALLASVALGVALVVTAVALAGSIDPGSIHINGEPLSIAPLDAGDWLMAVGGIALALLIVALVVPLAVLLPLAIAAVALVGALLAVAGVVAMLFSPLILLVFVVWLVVRLMRRDSAKSDGENRPDAGATIAG